MTLQNEIIEIEGALRTAGVPIDQILTQAGIDRSTWTRWKNGSVTGARYDSMVRVRAAVEEAAAQKRDAAA
ncbi:hypothetical protein [Phenylobacterium immobile]|uniref:hypothetical protein n=1 Tax=Phenylobacterium immobile TaxID=21 RepID=UPI000AABDB98|nr:hypothetical protein [Phenylobacterium immobile]